MNKKQILTTLIYQKIANLVYFKYAIYVKTQNSIKFKQDMKAKQRALKANPLVR